MSLDLSVRSIMTPVALSLGMGRKDVRRPGPHGRATVLRSVEAQLPTMTLARASRALARLGNDPAFWTHHIRSLLTAARAPEIAVARTWGTQQNGAVLQLFVWPPHAQTEIHDHASWGAILCLEGILHEERYQRLDDGVQPNTAHLRRHWERAWRLADGVTTVGPYERGIHRISNPSPTVTISAHLYGPRLALYDGRDYDIRHDYVCDRYEPETAL